MTKAELLSAAKLRVRKSATDSLDDDVQRLIDTALTDLERIGVKSSWLTTPKDPLIIEAVLSYVKANYSIADNYETLIGVYNMVLTKIKGDLKYFNTDAPEDEEPEPTPDPEPTPSGDGDGSSDGGDNQNGD